MNGDPASLSNLHEIVLPEAVYWWPLAPGWWVLACIVAVILVLLVRRAWLHWKADAYRRAALRELESMTEPVAVAELLRRTALAVAPRREIAALTGQAWLDWLDARSSTPMPQGVRRLLVAGVYAGGTTTDPAGAFREYASLWIITHRIG